MILMKMNSNIAIIITAAGSSTRMGSSIKKEYLPYNNGTVLSSCAKTFLKAVFSRNLEITDLIITYPKDNKQDCIDAIAADKELNGLYGLLHALHYEYGISPELVPGAETRQKSVYNALRSIKGKPDIVLIHDGARPFVTEKIILDTIDAVEKHGAAVPGITPTDTQKEIDENGFIVRHLQRAMLTAVQTPQGFQFEKLLQAHEKAIADGKEYTDDTEIWGNYIGPVKAIEGDVNNIKITYPGDLEKLNPKKRRRWGWK